MPQGHPPPPVHVQTDGPLHACYRRASLLYGQLVLGQSFGRCHSCVLKPALHVQAAHLKVLKGLPGLTGRTVRLVGKAELRFGNTTQKGLIIKPYAQHIPFETPFEKLLEYMRQLVDTVDRLHQAGYLHRVLSYSNLLVAGNQAIIADWQTMGSKEVGCQFDYLR